MKASQKGLVNQIRRVLFPGEVESNENRAPQIGGGCLASKSKSRRGQRQKWSDRAPSNVTSVLANINTVPQRNSRRVENSEGGLLSLFVPTEKEYPHNVKRSRNYSMVTSSLLGVESQTYKPRKKGHGRKSRQQVEQVNVSQRATVSRSDATSLVPKIESSDISVLAGEPAVKPRWKASLLNVKEDSGSVLAAPPQKSRDHNGWPMAFADSGVVSSTSAASSKVLKRKKTRMRSDAFPSSFIVLTTATPKKAQEDDALMTTKDSPESDSETKPTKRKDTRPTPSKLATNEATIVDLMNAIDSIALTSPMEEENTALTTTIASRAPSPPVENENDDLPNAIDSPALSSPTEDEKEDLMNANDSSSLALSMEDEPEARLSAIDPLAVTSPMENETEDNSIAIDALVSPAEVGKDDHTIAIDSPAPTFRVENEEEQTKPPSRLVHGSRVFKPRRKASLRNVKEDSGSLIVASPQTSRDDSGWPMAYGDSGVVSSTSAAPSKALKRNKTRMKSDAVPSSLIDLTTETPKKVQEDDALMATKDSPGSNSETKPTKRKDTRPTPSKLATNEAALVDLMNAIDSIALTSPMEEANTELTTTIASRAPPPPVENENDDLPNAIDSPALTSPMEGEKEDLMSSNDLSSLAPSAEDEQEARLSAINPLAVTSPMENKMEDDSIAIDALVSPAEVGKDDHTIAIDSPAPTFRVENEEEKTKSRPRLVPGSRVYDVEYIPISSFGSPPKEEVTKADSDMIMETEEQEMRRSSRRQVPTDRFSPSLAMKQAQLKGAKYSSESRDQSLSFSSLPQSETETSAAVELVEQVKRRSGRRQIPTDMFSPSAAMKEAQLKASKAQDEAKRRSSKVKATKSFLRKKQRKDLPPKSRRQASDDASLPDEKESSINQRHVPDPVKAMQLASPLSYLSQKMQEMQASRNECQENETETTEKKPSSGSHLLRRIQSSHVTANAEVASSETLTGVWNDKQLRQLQLWQSQANPISSNFWADISENVDGKSAQECKEKWFSQVKTPGPRAKRASQKKSDGNLPATTAMPLDTNDEDDIFNSTPLRGTLFPSNSKWLMESEEVNNINFDVGSPVLMSARRDRRISTEYDDDGSTIQSLQQKVGYKSYLMGLKRGVARAKQDKKVAKKKQNSANGTARNMIESVVNGDVLLKCKLSPGGTLQVENLTEVDIEDDCMCCSSDSSDCDE